MSTTATAARAAAAERQRRRRARLALQAEPRQPQECGCCGRLWVPTRQGRYCSRQCVERSGALRRRLAQSQQLQALGPWLAAPGRRAGAARRATQAQTVAGRQRASLLDLAERSRLLEAHRHLLEPATEAELVMGGWLWGPAPGHGRHSAMAQVDPELAQARSWGCRW
jgi:hypothetical protein